MFDIVTIGDATLDTFLDIHEASVLCDINKKKCHLCFNYGDKIPITGASQSMGGNAANVAAGVARLGKKTAIVTELGDDINGQTIIQELESRNINTNSIIVNKKDITRYSVILTYHGERTILAYHPKNTYSKPKIPRARWIYFTSLGTGSEVIQNEVLKFKKKYPEIKLVANPGSFQLRGGLNEFKKIIPFLEIIFLNYEEAEKIVGTSFSVKKLLLKMAELGPKIVVITNGSNGSYVWDGGRSYEQKNYPVKVLSKTGAGDAFASGFLGAVTSGLDISTAMKWGTANAAGVIQKFGAQTGLLSSGQIQSFIRRH